MRHFYHRKGCSSFPAARIIWPRILSSLGTVQQFLVGRGTALLSSQVLSSIWPLNEMPGFPLPSASCDVKFYSSQVPPEVEAHLG